MRFRTNSSSSLGLDPRLQRRMLGYVALIALGMIVFQVFSGRKPVRPAGGPVPTVAPGDQPFVVRDDVARPLDADEFRSFPSDSESTPPLQSPQRGSRYSLDPNALSRVVDNTLYVRRDEFDAFFYALDRARQIPPAQFELAAEQGVQYLNLMHEPGRYRGEPITLVGDLWQLHEFAASENPFGFEKLYEAWILTADSGPQPFRVVCSSLGPDITLQSPKPISVKVTGYFFKREGYLAQGGQRVAPTVLASRIERYVSALAPPTADGLVPAVMGIVVAVGLILATTLVSFAWSDRRTPARAKRLPAMSNDTQDALAALDYRSVQEQLKELEQEHRHQAWTQSRPERPKVENRPNSLATRSDLVSNALEQLADNDVIDEHRVTDEHFAEEHGEGERDQLERSLHRRPLNPPPYTELPTPKPPTRAPQPSRYQPRELSDGKDQS